MNEINTSLQKLMIGIQKCENADDDIGDDDTDDDADGDMTPFCLLCFAGDIAM